MSEESNYLAEQEYREYRRLINSVEILTQSEYELCKKWNAEETLKYLNNIGPAWKDGGFNGENRWLNINVYSEYEHEKRQFEMETGVIGSFDNL
jgi:hypothetical protein